jgi:hypothetical protein
MSPPKTLRYQMRRNDTDELPWRYDFGFLPESREMLLIASYQIVCSGSIGTFQEHIVVRIPRDFNTPGRSHGKAAILDDLQQSLPRTLPDPQFRTAEYFAVFVQDRSRDIKSRRFGNREQEDRALESSRLNGGGNQHICVDYKAKRKHYRFGFRNREALMILSIWRDVNVLVPLRSESSPMTLNTSGSGAANLT